MSQKRGLFGGWFKAIIIIILISTYLSTYKGHVSNEAEKVRAQLQESAAPSNQPTDVIVPKIESNLPSEQQPKEVEKPEDSNAPTPSASDILQNLQATKKPEDTKTIINNAAQSLFNAFSHTEKGKKILQGISREAAYQQSDEYFLMRKAAEENNKVHIMDVLKGTGNTAYCGSKVTIDYTAYLPDNTKFDTTFSPEHKPLTFTIGKEQVIPGLEQGLVGMMAGGERKMSIPPLLGFNNRKFINNIAPVGKILVYDVNLISLKNGISPVMAKNDADITTLEKGNLAIPALCGKHITLEYTAKLKDGSALTKEPVNLGFNFGDDTAPFGLEKAILGLHQGGVYDIELPADSLTSMSGKMVMKLKDLQPVTFTVSLISIDTP